MREVVVLGVGMHRTGRFDDISLSAMGREAVLMALREADIPWSRIQAAYSANRDAVPAGPGVRILGTVGMTGIPIINVSNASCSGATAFWEAHSAVAHGQFDIALALGTEKMARGFRPPQTGVDSAEAAMGLQAIPSWFAMNMKRRMHDYGETELQYAKVAVKNHLHASKNPYAQYRKVFTLEEIMASRVISDPIKLLDMCPTSDGAAAAILCTREVARQYTSKLAISVASCVLRTDVYRSLIAPSVPTLSRTTSQIAYDDAGIGPEDIDVIELHDPATVQEIIHYEDLALCPIGDGGKLVDEKTTELGGRVPVNPSGGLLSRGHPVGATGIAQIAELVWHLRGEAGGRQVEGAKVALAHLEGAGGGRSDFKVASVIILKR
ncbi:MAG: thiolase family protein [Hyphomicrobiales bacterium]|nr:thiolase family protein [Hyphomicrobiales bacterium]